MVVEGELSVEPGGGGGSVVWAGSVVFVVLSGVVVIVVVGAGVVVVSGCGVVVVEVVVVVSVVVVVGGGVVMGKVVSGMSVDVVVMFGSSVVMVVVVTGSFVSSEVSFSNCGSRVAVSFCRGVMVVVAAGSVVDGVGGVVLMAFCCGRVCVARGVASRKVARSTTTWLIRGMPGTSSPVVLCYIGAFYHHV